MKDGTYLAGVGGAYLSRVDLPDGYTVAVRPLKTDRHNWPFTVGLSGHFVGCWTNPSTGKAEWDLVIEVPYLEEALIVAKALNQEAIWDNAAQSVIYLDQPV